MAKKKEKQYYDVGILSYNLYTSNNYGAVLHTYAFQQYLDKVGINNVIVDYRPPQRPFIKAKKIIKTKGWSFWFRSLKFKSFFKKYYRITDRTYNYDSLIHIDNISRFVCETDVTWSFSKKYGFDKGFFCDFNNMKYKDNVAYSVDFGSKLFTPEAEEEIKYLAKNFKYISIRNVFKKDYLQNILNRNDIRIVADSVFLLDREDYMKIAKFPKMKKKYVLVYNCVENNEELLKTAKEFAQKNNLEVMELSLFKDNKTIEKKILTASVEEFLGYVDRAEYIFTNSYHGICFSVLFNKQFYAFARTGNSEKIQSVLESFGLGERLYDEETGLIDKKIDYDIVKPQIAKVVAEAKDFINTAIVENKPQ